MRLAQLSCSCYPVTIPGRSFSLLCCQSRAYGSVQSPRSLCLRSGVYSYPEFGVGNRQTESFSKLSYTSSHTSTHEVIYRMYPDSRIVLLFKSIIPMLLLQIMGLFYCHQFQQTCLKVCCLLIICALSNASNGQGCSPMHSLVILIYDMYKNSSFIDILQGISTAEESPDHDPEGESLPSHQEKSNFINSLPHYESTQYLRIPHECTKQILSPTHRNQSNVGSFLLSAKIKKREILSEQQIQHKDQSRGLALSDERNKSAFSNKVRTDQTSFKIKLKLASFITKFNIDPQFLSNVREHSIDSILEIMFNKFKEYAKEHEKLVKTSNEAIKTRQIEILNLKSQLSTLEEMNCQQINRYHKAKDKQKDEHTRLQTTIDAIINENQELKQTAYMLEQIVKEQNQYIKGSKVQASTDLQAEVESLHAQLQVYEKRCIALAKQAQSLEAESMSLHEQNARLNDEINEIMQQNKNYKHQTMFAKQSVEKMQVELEANEEKLIDLFEKYQSLDQQLKNYTQENQQMELKNRRLINQYSKALQEIEKGTALKQRLAEENNLLVQQIIALKAENEEKEKEVLRLSKSLSQIVSSYKSRQLQRKNKSVESDAAETYRINIISEDSTKVTQSKMNEMKANHEAQVRQIIQGWKSQLENTVNYYEKLLEDYQKQLSERQALIDSQ